MDRGNLKICGVVLISLALVGWLVLIYQTVPTNDEQAKTSVVETSEDFFVGKPILVYPETLAPYGYACGHRGRWFWRLQKTDSTWELNYFELTINNDEIVPCELNDESVDATPSVLRDWDWQQ